MLGHARERVGTARARALPVYGALVVDAEPDAVPVLPVQLALRGRRCLVVGGGRVGSRRAASLAAAGGDVLVVATRLSRELRSDARLTCELRGYQPGEANAYAIVVAATDVSSVNQLVCADAEAGGAWVNVADDADRSTLTFPAVARQGRVVVAVSTGGASPALAAALAGRIGSDLEPGYARLAELLSAARAEWRRSGARGRPRDWHELIGPEMLELMRTGQIDRAEERVERWLSSS